MRPSLRFLAIAVVGWAGVRAAALGVLPGAEMFSIEKSEAKVPPIAQTQFPPIDPVEPAPTFAAMQPAGASQMQPQFLPAGVPVYYTAPNVYYAPPPAYYRQVRAPRPERFTPILPEPEPERQFYSALPPLDPSPLSRLASAGMSKLQSAVPAQSVPAAFAQPASKLDRIQLSSWAMLRGRQGEPLGPNSLGSVGNLGGSQAGARLLYNFSRQLAVSLRTTSDVGRQGGEAAAGVRVQPIASIPVWVTAERRQKIGRMSSGRSDFALFAEGGVYQRPMPGRFQLDAYVQGGIVGLRSRDLFVDGGLALTRPLYRNFSGGFGLWGGAQPGIYRVDAGPRVTMSVRRNVKVHFDWRQKLAGNAQPGSGPAVTLSGDF
jgi:hypothetical protein